jgi:SET domain-containing protein
MLIVPVIVKKSPIGGKGIFAKSRIRKGSIIVRIGEAERYYSKKQCQEFSPRYREILSKFAYWDKKNKHLVYPLDNTKHLNHSCAPNVLNLDNLDLAARDIEKGEELTYDYRPILMRGERFKCNCGSGLCRGVIRPK